MIASPLIRIMITCSPPIYKQTRLPKFKTTIKKRSTIYYVEIVHSYQCIPLYHLSTLDSFVLFYWFDLMLLRRNRRSHLWTFCSQLAASASEWDLEQSTNITLGSTNQYQLYLVWYYSVPFNAIFLVTLASESQSLPVRVPEAIRIQILHLILIYCKTDEYWELRKLSARDYRLHETQNLQEWPTKEGVVIIWESWLSDLWSERTRTELNWDQSKPFLIIQTNSYPTLPLEGKSLFPRCATSAPARDSKF